MIMSPQHYDWEEFYTLLEGPEGCDFREVDGQTIWECVGDKRHTIHILKTYFPEIDVKGTLDFFDDHGGCCDCMILFNVEDDCGYVRDDDR